jgi:hypothetical protein
MNDGDSYQLLVERNNSSAFTAVANEGYHFKYWKSISGDSLTNINPLTILGLMNDTVLSAVFEKNSYTVAFSKLSGGGVIEGELNQVVLYQENSSSVTALPFEGYHFVQWESIFGDSITNMNPIVVRKVFKDTALRAIFDINTYSLSFTSRGNGFIEGDSLQFITYGSDAELITAVAHTGYHFSHWELINSDSVTNINPLIISNVISDTAYVAIFSPGFVSVDELDNINFKIYPNPVKNMLTIEANNLNRVVIIDIYGKVLHNKDVSSNSITIDMNRYQSGIYMLYLITDDSKRAIKIVKN